MCEARRLWENEHRFSRTKDQKRFRPKKDRFFFGSTSKDKTADLPTHRTRRCAAKQ